jgi:hypothetical protein
MARMRPDIRSSGVEPHVREALLPLHKVATSASKVHMSSSIARVLRGRTTLTLHTFAAYGVCPFPTYGYVCAHTVASPRNGSSGHFWAKPLIQILLVQEMAARNPQARDNTHK